MTNERYPPEINWFFTHLARLLLRITGWSYEGELPTAPKFIIVSYPHTSNWDGIIVVVVAMAMRMKVHWLGKDSLFKSPLLARFFRWTGGIPIDRSSSHRALKSTVQAFQDYPTLALVISPEGTRQRQDMFKPGFYFLAQKANVPMLLGTFDYTRKLVMLGPLIYPTGDIHADMQPMYAFYQRGVARYPENATPVQLPPRKDRVQSKPSEDNPPPVKE